MLLAPLGLSALVRECRPIGLQGFGELIKGPSAAQMTALLTGKKKPSGVALIMWSAATEDKVQRLKGEFQLNISWPYSSLLQTNMLYVYNYSAPLQLRHEMLCLFIDPNDHHPSLHYTADHRPLTAHF